MTHEILTGDCRDLLRAVADASVDLVLTDPPYGHRNNDGDLIANREKALGRGKAGPPRPIANDGPEANDLLRAVLPEIRRVAAVPGFEIDDRWAAVARARVVEALPALFGARS